MHTAAGIDGVEIELCTGTNVAAGRRKRAGQGCDLPDDDIGECVSGNSGECGKNEGCSLEHADHCHICSSCNTDYMQYTESMGA